MEVLARLKIYSSTMPPLLSSRSRSFCVVSCLDSHGSLKFETVGIVCPRLWIPTIRVLWNSGCRTGKQ